jgi:hypothetical protein
MVSVLLRYQIVGAPDPPMSDLPYRLHARRSFKTSSANGSCKSRPKMRAPNRRRFSSIVRIAGTDGRLPMH